jgi:hypothetical protein
MMSLPGRLLAPSGLRPGVHSARNLAITASVLGLSFLVFFPLFPSMPSAALDPSWRMALNEAWVRDFNFARDVVFTYGPYAFLETGQYDPGTYRALLWCSLLLGATLLLLLRYLEPDERTTFRTPIVLLALVVSGYTSSPDVRFLCFAFLLLVAAARPPGAGIDGGERSPLLRAPVVLNLGAFCLGLLCLVKATYFVEVAVVGALSMIALYTTRRRLLAAGIMVSFVFGLTLFWLMAGQHLGDLARFFSNQAQMAAGYGEAMSTAGGLLPPALFLLAAVPLAVAVRRELRPATLVKSALAAGMAVTLFLAFKEGFVREDESHVMTAAELLLILPWCWPWRWPLERGGVWQMAQTAMAVATGVVFIVIYPGALSKPATDLAGYLHCSERGPIACPTHGHWLDESYELSLARIRAQVPMPQVQGTVDVYTERQSLAIANGFRWDPRPVMQSYGAYTPALAQLNAEHLTGAKAPDGVLVGLEAIDHRLPSLADGPSWPILLTQYGLKGIGNPAYLKKGMPLVFYLRRKPDWQRISVARTPLLEANIGLGRELDLPKTDAALFAQIDIRPNLLGKMADLLLDSPRLYIQFEFPDGHLEHYRLPVGAARAGFVISPVVIDSTNFVVLSDLKVRQTQEGRRPVAIWLISTTGGRLVWTHAAAVKISELRETHE